jgi:large repetitive protein
MRICLAVATALLLAIANFAVHAIEIHPQSYVFDQPTGTGTYTYHDETGNQLTDDKYGVAPWWADLGNGPAYEWVGWVRKPVVNIDFDFGATTRIDHIAIGSTQDEPADVVLPSIDIFSSKDGATWTLLASLVEPESCANNGVYQTYGLDNLGIDAQFVRVAARFSADGPWTFIDEVDFQVNAVPVPAPFWLMFPGLVALLRSRR